MKLDPRREHLLKHTFLDFKQTSEFIQEPLILDRAEGLYYWDTDGKRYFDAIESPLFNEGQERPNRLVVRRRPDKSIDSEFHN